MTTASLIVTTYNWKEALALCLRSIATQAVLPSEVIVADDGSRDDTGDLVYAMSREFPVPLKHAWQRDLGFRAARVRNLGIAASRVASTRYACHSSRDIAHAVRGAASR